MKSSEFDFFLPEALIAQTPLDRRDQSRLMVLERETGALSHHHFYDLPQLLRPGDCLVLNDSRVIPARLIGHRDPSGGLCELVLLKDAGGGRWECMARPGRRLKVGAQMTFGEGRLTGQVVGVLEGGLRLVQFTYQGIFLEVLEALGTMPLPPYIKKQLVDQERYQTVYARVNGSAAAPTAGLHFTPQLLETLESMGVILSYITLHVGLGTFQPVKVEDVTQHVMHQEYCTVPQETAEKVNQAKREGRRVICVGTTSCRTLESFGREDGILEAGSGWTNIFIYPGYSFRILDGLITNFHLPQSTLLMLVSALAGKEQIERAYAQAVAEEYRFFSFGDAMLIV